MRFGFTYNESLLERSAIINHVEDVEVSTSIVLDVQNIGSDFVIESVRLWTRYFLGAWWWFRGITNVTTMRFSGFNVFLRDLCCSQHLHQRILW